MDYKQKYNEALERAKAWVENRCMPSDTNREGVLEDIFPELKKLEDERIRKTLIDYFNTFAGDYYGELKKSHILAWLEKQSKKEQLYIRFGEIPTDEKSKIFQGEIEVGTENGVSVYPAFKTSEGDIVLGLSLPITKTTLYTQQHLLEYDDRPCYLVKGDYVGKDTDGQPLINNISIIEKIDTYRVKEKKQGEQKSSIRERYDKIKNFEWFKKTHEGMSVSEEPDNSYCREHCKGFQETGKCFADGACSAKIKAESVDKAKPKFKVGDWVVYYRNDSSREVLQVYDIRDGRYYFTDNVHFSWSVKECDEKSHLWTISDARAGDVLFHSDSASNGIFIFKELLKYGFSEKVICYCDYDSEDGFCLGEHHTCCWSDAKILHPATKEQCDILFSKIKDAGYKWDVEKKELKIIDWSKHIKYEPNSPSIIEESAWNEEDEKLTDVDHEYFSKLLKNDNSNNIDDYAYQVAYCMSHDWIKETATWDDIQKACKLGAEWNEKCHKSAWSKEDDEFITAAICFIDSYNHDNGFACNGIHKDDVSKWILSLKERMGGKL